MRRFFLLIACLVMLISCLQIGLCKDYGSISTDSQIRECILKVPDNYKDGNRKIPLLVYLHGGAAFNNYDNLQKEIEGFVDRQRQYSFILFAPLFDIPGSSNFKSLKNMMDEIIEKYPVDPTRIYLAGVSAGGREGWEFAIENPDLFAAFLSNSGGPLRDVTWDESTLENVGVLKNLPIRAYHGAHDDVVPLEKVQIIINVLKEAGGKPTLIVIPGAGHVVAEGYSDAAFNWLFGNKKRN